jgi:hypothetical protein
MKAGGRRQEAFMLVFGRQLRLPPFGKLRLPPKTLPRSLGRLVPGWLWSTNIKRLKSSSLLPSALCLVSTTNINADLLSMA